MIVDASVWVEYLRGNPLPSVLLLRSAIHEERAPYSLPVVLQETLQGARNSEVFQRWRKVLMTFPMLQTPDPRDTAISAADLYARCRWSGITPRSGNDCLIAVSCIELGQPLLQRDRDFERIAALEPRLRLVAA